jgi:hypothetical protein
LCIIEEREKGIKFESLSQLHSPLPPSVLCNDLTFILALLQGELAKTIVRNKAALEELLEVLRKEKQTERERERKRAQVMNIIQKEYIKKSTKIKEDKDDLKFTLDTADEKKESDCSSIPLALPPPSIQGQLEEDVVQRQR